MNIRQIFQDKEYYSSLLRLGLPIAVQNLIASSLNTTSVLLIGQKGETSVAAVGLANQVVFLLILFLFGVSSGTAVFTAQFWGVRDIASIRKVQGLGLGIGLTIGTIFTVLALSIPRSLLSIYTSDPAVIELGSQYLRIHAFSYMGTAIVVLYSAVLRSTGEVRLPTYVSVFTLSFGTLLSYVLIFGHLGLPEMGVRGAATGTTVAIWLEVALLLGFTYGRKLVAAAKLSELFGANLALVKRYLITASPVVGNEMAWALGITTYNAIYAHIGTSSVAAVNIASTIEGMAFSIFFGMANATAILLGNLIGAGNEGKAFEYGQRALVIGAIMAVLVGGLMALIATPVMSLYNVSADVQAYGRNILFVLGSVLWIRVSNMNIIVGILRSGGDTRFSFLLEAGTIWLVGVPLAYIGAFVLHFPIYAVVLMVMGEELAKLCVGLWRYRSKRWIHNLAKVVGEAQA